MVATTTTKASTTKPRTKSAGSARKTSTSSQARPTTHATVRHEAAIVARGAAAAAIGTALAALGGRALIASRSQKRVLGVPLPHKHTTVKSIAKQVADMAGQLERRSADVSKASARAKHAAQVLS
jgi:hypothetical protein